MLATIGNLCFPSGRTISKGIRPRLCCSSQSGHESSWSIRDAHAFTFPPYLLCLLFVTGFTSHDRSLYHDAVTDHDDSDLSLTAWVFALCVAVHILLLFSISHLKIIYYNSGGIITRREEKGKTLSLDDRLFSKCIYHG